MAKLGRKPWPRDAADRPGGPLSDALRGAARAAVAGGEFNAYSLARTAKLDDLAVRKVLVGGGDIALASAEKLFGALRLALARRPDQPLSEALRAEVIASGLNPNALGVGAGVAPMHVRRFIDGRGDITLATADRLAGHLELEVIRRAETRPVDPKPATGPFSGPLRAAIAERGLDTLELSKATGACRYSLERFIEGHGDLNLTTVDSLFEFLTLAVVRESDAEGDRPLQSPSDAVRSAIAGGGLSYFEMARRSGGHSDGIAKFARGEGGMMLSTADGIAVATDLGVIQGTAARRPETDATPVDDPLKTINDFLRSTCQARGLRCNALARLARLSNATMSRFLNRIRDLDYDCARKLASGLGVGLVPSNFQASPAEAPPVGRRRSAEKRPDPSPWDSWDRAVCPVQVRDDGHLVVFGRDKEGALRSENAVQLVSELVKLYRPDVLSGIDMYTLQSRFGRGARGLFDRIRKFDADCKAAFQPPLKKNGPPFRIGPPVN